jgi:hypothetical protein
MSTCTCGCTDGSCSCPPLIPVPPVDACVVQFDYGRWSTRYPEFSAAGIHPVSSALAQEYFYDATLYLDNTCSSPVCDASIGGERERLLFLMTAHLAAITGAGSPGGAPTPGRITNKAVGPVSVGYGGLDGLPANSLWFAQTAYGFAFWQATAAYRTFQYRVPYVPANFPYWPLYR